MNKQELRVYIDTGQLYVHVVGKILEMSYKGKSRTLLIEDIGEALDEAKKFYEELA